MRSGSCCNGLSRGLTQGSVLMPGWVKAWWGCESPRLHPGPGPASSTVKLTLCPQVTSLRGCLPGPQANPQLAGNGKGMGHRRGALAPNVEGEFPFVRLGKQQV